MKYNKCPICGSDAIYCIGTSEVYIDDVEFTTENAIFMCDNCESAFYADLHATVDSFVIGGIIATKPDMNPTKKTLSELIRERENNE